MKKRRKERHPYNLVSLSIISLAMKLLSINLIKFQTGKAIEKWESFSTMTTNQISWLAPIKIHHQTTWNSFGIEFGPNLNYAEI